MPDNLNIIISGGGTGGHLYPAIAIRDQIIKEDPRFNVHFVGSDYGIEKKTLPQKGYQHTLLPIRGFQRQFNFSSFYKNSVLPYKLIKSNFLIQKLYSDLKPKLVIGTGGYASAIPLREGIKRNIPVIIQEQNAFPGITTRWFSNRASKVFIAFKEAQDFIEKKCILIGNPVRNDIDKGETQKGLQKFSLCEKRKTVLIFGGSQGSLFINEIISKIIYSLSKLNIQFLWQTGPMHFRKFKKFENDMIKVLPYIDNMADAYAISDLVVCRSGAITCSELTYCGKPSILIPLKSAAGNHQSKNAKSLSKNGAAIMIEEVSVSESKLKNSIINIINSEEKLKKMSSNCKKLKYPDAANKISKSALELIKNV
tara:strand:- start:1145 stop:2248 length:1104 start_codon:yes stop_codon:yes gene_type:complete